jgi:hypothetical protein
MQEPTKKVAILQSNYIPWKGYFDLIAAVDEFIIYDDMQFTKNDWRNRNQIKTPNGQQWLTIPVGKAISRKIREVKIESTAWQKKHWRTLEMNYGRTPCFSEIAEWLRPLYLEASYTSLSELNQVFIQAICDYLNIRTRISRSWDYKLIEGKTERVVDLCLQSKASEYISGPSAKDYIDESQFLDNKITLTWFDYSAYVAYPQLWGEFAHGVSILDLLFNCGKKSPDFMKIKDKSAENVRPNPSQQ